MWNSPPPPPPVAVVAAAAPSVDAPRVWGSGGASEQLKASSKFVLQQASAYPCLDVLYPGKFRFHCQRCTDDAAISKFTRHRFYLFYGFTEAGGEKLYRLPLALANSYVEGCARGRIRPGICIKAGEEAVSVVSGSPVLTAEELTLQEHDDSIPALCNAVVRDQYEIFADGMEAYVLQSLRVPPYLLVVHENSAPSAMDVRAFENGYSMEFMTKIDADYHEALVGSFKR